MEEIIQTKHMFEELFDDYKTAKDYELVENSVIKINELLSININIETVYGKYIAIKMGKGNRIIDINNAIIKKMRFNRVDHILEYQGSEILHDNMTIDEVGIIDGCVIKVLERSRICIFIEASECKTLPLELRKSDRIVQLKDLIKENMNLDLNKYVLQYKESILSNDNMTLDEYGILDKGVIRVLKPTKRDISILVKPIGDAKPFPLTIKNDEKIFDIKKKIQSKIEMSSDEQKIVYRDGVLDDDSKTVDYYQVSEGSIIKVVVKERYERQLFVKIDGKTISIQCTESDRIIKLKELIKKNVERSLDRIILSYKGMMLDDERTVDFYSIEERGVIDTIVTLRGGRQIFFKTINESRIPMGFIGTDKIIYVKKKICECMGLSPYGYKLVYNGIELEDDNTVEFYEIDNKDCVMIIKIIRPKIEVKVRRSLPPDLTFSMNGTDKIIDLKNKISEKTGHSPDEYKLEYHSGVLEDELTLDHYEISGKEYVTCVQLIRDSIQIWGTTNEGVTQIFAVNVFDKIIDLKKKIRDKMGLSLDIIVITFNGMILRDDNLTLFNCGILNNSSVAITVATKIKLNVLTLTAESIQIEILDIDRIIDIKKKIQDKLSMLPSQQWILYRGTLLNNASTINESGISSDGDVTCLSDSGICLVINNEFPGTDGERHGTQIDVENIRCTFEPMRYKIKVETDVIFDDMSTIFDRTKDDVNVSHRMLIIFVLSHGEREKVITADIKRIGFKDIWTPFTSANFDKFDHRPKLFFFCCCRSSNGTPVDVNSEEVYPSLEGMFVGFAAQRWFDSHRYSDTGTLYVYTLCEVIREHKYWSVSDIHQEVQARLTKEKIWPKQFSQHPSCDNSLLKHAYFMEEY